MFNKVNNCFEEVYMKTITQLLKTAIIFISLFFITCNNSKEGNSHQIPKTTSKTEFRKPFTADMVKTSNGIIVNNDGSLIHIGEGDVTLISRIMQPSFSTFHTGAMVYIINEKAKHVELRERLKINFRLTMDGGETWTRWNDDEFTLLSTESKMLDEEPDSLFVFLLSGSKPENLYNGLEIKIISNVINKGKIIVDVLDFDFYRKSTEWFDLMKGNREAAERKKNSKNNST